MGIWRDVWTTVAASTVLGLSFTLEATSQPSEPTIPGFAISSSSGTVSFSVSDLLARKDLKTVTIPRDPAYSNKEMIYQAVPIASLFRGIEVPAEASIQFYAIDGFSGPLSRQNLLNEETSKPIAYLAVEDPKQRWPLIHPGKDHSTAGPYYLVWKSPPGMKDVPGEEWPFQVARLEVKGSLGASYPKIFPKSVIPAKSAIRRGFGHFLTNCFPCHTMNGQGEGRIGPDLNLPMNPTEYLRPRGLRALIRNPQSVRAWPNLRMTGFAKEALSDRDLDDLIAYLKHMSGNKAN